MEVDCSKAFARIAIIVLIGTVMALLYTITRGN
jgi:hypothetical protein